MKSPNNAIFRTVICILFSVTLTSCSKNLTRTDAKHQLEATYTSKGKYEYIKCDSRSPYAPKDSVPHIRIPTGQLRKSLPDVAALSDAGLLQVTVIASRVPYTYATGVESEDHIVITPTETAKPFLAGAFPAEHITLVAATPTIQILGITEPAEGLGRKMSSVTFQVTWKNTQVGHLLNRSYSIDEERAIFVKYDNGWRLEQ